MRVELRHTGDGSADLRVPRRARGQGARRVAVAALLGLGGPAAVTTLAVPPAAAGERPASGATSLSDARRSVEAATARRDEVTAQRDHARARLRDLDAASADVVDQLADARRELRDRAVAAYVGQSPIADPMLSMLTDDFADASARTQIAASAADNAHATVVRYRRLRGRVRPRVARLSRSLQQLDQRVHDAEDALLAARATEAEAERQLRLEAEFATASLTTTTIDAVVESATAESESPTTDPARVPTTAMPATAAPTTAPPTAPPTAAPVTAPAPTPTSPPTAPPTSPPTTQAPRPSPPGGPTEEQWARLRNCESGGNYRAVSASGRYRGAYQFDTGTWATLGSPGDPAAAPPAEQDYRAKLLYSRRGWRPWPVCGRYLR